MDWIKQNPGTVLVIAAGILWWLKSRGVTVASVKERATKAVETVKSHVTFTHVLVGAVAIYFALSNGFIKLPDAVTKLLPSKPGVTVPASPVPANLVAAAEPIKAIAAKNPSIAKDLGGIYRGFSDVARRDTGKLKSTEQVRAWLIDADALAMQGTPIVGVLPGFGDAKNTVIKVAIGLEVVPMDATKRAALADALLAVAEALGG